MNIKKIFTKRGFNIIKNIIEGFAIGIVGKAMYGIFRKEDIWIITERYNEARDNGLELFMYIKEKTNKNNVYYVIEKSSADCNKFKDHSKDIIWFGTIKHHFLYWIASRHISTHINGYMPNEKAYLFITKVLKPQAKKVFLQHGIIKDLLPQLFMEKTNLDLFVCGAEKEYQFIKEKFGYKENVVQYLGLCRYDKLNEFKIKKQILIMPTFRKEFFLEHEDKINDKVEKNFIDSSFFCKYSALLENKKMIDELCEKNIEIIFYPHYEMQKYLYLFKNIDKRIKIACTNTYDIQKLLKESAILITDYSSVFFDFAYMEKPIIYYQFDYDEYRKKHYKEGYFDYKKNGFGEVFNEEQKVISKVLEYANNKYMMEERYRKRVHDFFVIRDKENCKRNYNAIRRIGEKIV